MLLTKLYKYDISPVYRKPEIIAEEISLVQEMLGSPVFITGDINRAGSMNAI